MSSKTYIIAWDKALENCYDIDRQLSKAGISYKFYNVSSNREEIPNWDLSEDVRYYMHFYNALKDFLQSGKKVFGFNAGDPHFTNWEVITAKAEKVLKNPGVYAPNMAGDFLSESGVYLEDSARYTDLYLATQTNGMCVYLNWDIAGQMFDFMAWAMSEGLDFKSMVSGWGLDSAYCLIAVLSKAPIYRDSELYINHPPGTSYNSTNANKEMKLVDAFFDRYAEKRYKVDISRIKELRELIFTKARKRDSYNLTVSELYGEVAPNWEEDVIW